MPTVAPSTGPAAGAKRSGEECPRCGRGEIVSVIVPPVDEDAIALVGPEGEPVKAGAHVQMCALCGQVLAVKDKVRRSPQLAKRRAARSKPKTKTASSRKRASSKRTTRKRGR
jgi:ribosomal protein S27AE